MTKRIHHSNKKHETQKKIESFLSSWKNRIYSGKLYFIEDKQAKKVPFIPNESQRELYENLHFYNLIPKARQRGFSTAIEILWLDHCIFNKNISMGVIAHNLEDAKKIFKTKVKFPYDNLWGFNEKSPEYAVWQEIKRNVFPVKDNESTLEFSNGSSIYVSTSFRSGTLQFLHISEFWKIASKYPEKAKEIISGAMEAVWEGWMIFIESTAEGKNDFWVLVKYGEKLRLMGKKLNHLEPKLFFFAWWEASEYRLDDDSIELNSETINYFKMLKKEHWIEVDKAQARWWQVKKERLKELMSREYPSYLDEAFEVIVMGAYYKKQLELLLTEWRFWFYPHDPRYPVYLTWDLGMRDAKDLTFFQLIGSQIRIIKWWRWSNMSFTDFHTSVLSKLSFPIKKIFFPHDSKKRNENDWFSVYDTAKELWYDVQVLKASSILWWIELVRDLFGQIVIHSQDCVQPVKIWWELVTLSLVDMLSAYKEEFDKTHWIWLWRPEHNDASHTWDDIRYLWQAVEELRKESNTILQEAWSPDFDYFSN